MALESGCVHSPFYRCTLGRPRDPGLDGDIGFHYQNKHRKRLFFADAVHRGQVGVWWACSGEGGGHGGGSCGGVWGSQYTALRAAAY